jgi:putative membrane protein
LRKKSSKNTNTNFFNKGHLMSSDPRVFFAAERTLLAWVRSGITVMALGFVVAKFGLFLTLLTATGADNAHAHQNNDFSNVFGIALVIIGVVITLGAQYNHHIYVRTLPPQDVPELAISWLGSLLSLSIAFVGLLLAVYLILA